DPRFGIFLSKIGLRDPSQIDLLQEVQSAKTKSQEKTGTAKLDSRRIAVLPFTNISPDPKDEFFADGMTEELISTLSRIRELKVISRTSVMRYKQTEKSLSEIASDLNVNAVLEGSVRKMGDDLRITAQLIDVQNDEHLWSEDYDRKFENVFSLQREIALRVADSLKVSILSKESKELGKKPTQNMEAYVLYLKGRAYSYQMTIESFRKAIGYWEQAIQKDPNYAQAFASMAGVYILMGTSGLLPMSETFPKAQWFTEKAMQLDPSIPDSHAARGWVLFNQWDFRGAEIEIRRAVELGPNVVDGHLDLANLFAGLGRFDDCALECNRALELDPLSDITCTMVGILLTTAHYYDEAIEVLKNAIELDPNSAIARHNLGVAYVMKGMIEEGISEIKAVLETSKEKVANWMSDLAWAYAQAGNINEVRKILADLLRMNEQGHASETEIACVYVSLGEKDKAMEWLEKAFERHSGYLAWGLNADASFDNLRSDPKFQALRKKIGFPDVGSASS
ncbi:MAG TPA: tetratricopeptide repeat protein, partial [Nitrososphaerales archaeon]|nr:tetratricopeptide repeat protein [Nitrososphaerales archaeon]